MRVQQRRQSKIPFKSRTTHRQLWSFTLPLQPFNRLFYIHITPMLLAAAVSALLLASPALADFAYPDPSNAFPGYDLVFADEFNNGTLNPDYWTADWDCTGWGNQMRSCYVSCVVLSTFFRSCRSKLTSPPFSFRFRQRVQTTCSSSPTRTTRRTVF